MDPAIVARMLDARQRFHYAVEILTTPVRRYTQWPGTEWAPGESVGGHAYTFRPFDLSIKSRRSDGSSRKAITLSFPDGELVVTDLAADLSHRGKAVRIAKIHSNEDWSVAGVQDVWFFGKISRPQIKGLTVILTLQAFAGRTGASPLTTMVQAFPGFRPPTEIEFVTLTRG